MPGLNDSTTPTSPDAATQSDDTSTTDQRTTQADDGEGADGHQHDERNGERKQPDPEKVAAGLKRRVDRLTAKNYELEQRLRSQPDPRQAEQRNDSDENDPNRSQSRDVDAEVRTRAQQIAADDRLMEYVSTKTQALLAKGKELDGFSELSDVVGETIPFVQRIKGQDRPTEFYQALLECDNPAAVIVHLGENQEELDRIEKLSPHARATALGRLDAKLGKDTAKPISRAPQPADRVSGRSNTTQRPQTVEDELQAIRRANGRG